MANRNKEIQKPHLILCEGVDSTYYIIELLKTWERTNPEFETFQALDFGGVEDLKTYLEALRLRPKYETVKSVTIIRDAEQDAQAAAMSVVNSLRSTGFYYASKANTVSEGGFPKTGFVLFPACNENSENGTLEDLCLSTLSQKNADEVLGVVASAVKNFKFKRPHKNYLHAYFSLTDEYVGLKIGEAAKALAFNFESSKIASLKRFLAQISSCSQQHDKNEATP
jgi:hypothetical protein